MKSTIQKKTEGYGYKYTELADINRYCEEIGVRYWQEVETNEINQKDYIITYIHHGYIVENDEATPNITKHRGCQIVEARLSGINNPVQAYGSSLTYCRRYSLLMALGLATEDDDGASLTEIKEMSTEDAEKVTINFGKYKGQTIKELIDNNNEYYINYLINNSKDPEILKAIEVLTGEKPKSDEEWDKELDKTRRLMQVIVEKDLDTDKILDHYKVKDLTDLTAG